MFTCNRRTINYKIGIPRTRCQQHIMMSCVCNIHVLLAMTTYGGNYILSLRVKSKSYQ